jgi:hypothetical protein
MITIDKKNGEDTRKITICFTKEEVKEAITYYTGTEYVVLEDDVMNLGWLDDSYIAGRAPNHKGNIIITPNKSWAKE